MFICLKMKSSLWPLTKNNLEMQNLHFSTFRVPHGDGLALKQKLSANLLVNKNYSHNQMKEIRLGLKDNLDVSEYLNPKINASQMKKIRLKLLENKVDINQDN